MAPLRNLTGRSYKSEDKQDFSQQEVGEKQAAGQRPYSKEVQVLRNMAADKSLPVSDICKTLGIGRTMFHRNMKEEGKK